MKTIMFIICITLSSQIFGSEYKLFDDNIYIQKEPDIAPVVITIEEDKKEDKIEEEHSIVVKPTSDHAKYLEEVYKYLFGATGFGLAGFLSRLGYLVYQTKTGKLLIKHIKTNAQSIENDIIESIDKLTTIESAEFIRTRLKTIEKYAVNKAANEIRKNL